MRPVQQGGGVVATVRQIDQRAIVDLLTRELWRCIVDDDGGVCGRDDCARCAAPPERRP